MKLLELYNKIKDLKLKGNVIVPFYKLEYNIKKISQFNIVPDVSIEFIEKDKYKPITFKTFINILDKAVNYAGDASKFVDVEMYYDKKEKLYNLRNVYKAGENLYLNIG